STLAKSHGSVNTQSSEKSGTESVESEPIETESLKTGSSKTKTLESKSSKSSKPTEPGVPKCPKTASISSGTVKKYIMKLSSKKAADKHYSMLENCFNKVINHNHSKGANHSKHDKNVKNFPKNQVIPFTIGDYTGYLAFFPSDVAAELNNLNEVDDVIEDIKVKIADTDLCYYESQDVSSDLNSLDLVLPNLDHIDQSDLPLDGYYNYPGSKGEGVTIYVVDTGINVNHSEFGGRATHGGTFCDGCPDFDDHGHGTHVAGIAGGSIHGVAKNVNLVAIKVLDFLGEGYTSDIILGLNYVASQHNDGDNTVINMSFTTTFVQALNDIVSGMSALGIHMVCAAGNFADDACQYSPGSAANVISVGATKPISNNIASFSNYGQCVGIFAPGDKIISAGILSNIDLAIMSGTSQASPHVAGTVALIISQLGNMSPDDMKSYLYGIATYDVITGLDNLSPNIFLRVPYPPSECSDSPPDPSQDEDLNQSDSDSSDSDTDSSDSDTDSSDSDTDSSDSDADSSDSDADPSDSDADPSDSDADPSDSDADLSYSDTDPSYSDTDPSYLDTDPSDSDTAPDSDQDTSDQT
ncbi:15931_t:CDS:2, partial [Cetraspora pellucida]